MSVTIKEIAEICGVSRGTVDRVLHGRGRVNSETAEIIKKKAEELGYSPNTLAKALAAKRNPLNFYVIIASLGNPLFDEIFAGINKAHTELADYGVNVIVKTVRGMDSEQQSEILEEIKKDASGVIITPAKGVEVRDKINEFTEKNTPVITLNTDIENCKRLCYIGSDYFGGGKTACGITGLIKGEKANIGIITDFDDSPEHSERIAGFESVANEKYPEFSVKAVTECENDDTKAYYVTKELLAKYPETDTLLIAAGGIYGCVRAVRDYDGKIDVICFDATKKNIELFKSGDIKAAVCQNPFEQGCQAVNTLFDYVVRGVKPEKELIYMSNEIKIYENFS